MKNHIVVTDQIIHLKNKKNITGDDSEFLEYLDIKPYEMTVQQVKFFFKSMDNVYIRSNLSEWKEKYEYLYSDSLLILHKIINLESKLKNELFKATYQNEKWLNTYKNKVMQDVSIAYYKRVNSSSMGEIIQALKILYEEEGINILTYKKQEEILGCTNYSEDYYIKLRSINARIYIDNVLKNRLKDGSINLIEIQKINDLLRKEVKEWIIESVKKFETKEYIDDLIPNIFETFISKSSINKWVINDKLSKDKLPKINDNIMLELINEYKISGEEFVRIKRSKINCMTNNILLVYEKKIREELKGIYQQPQSDKSKEWVKYLKSKDIDINNAHYYLKKTHVDSRLKRASEFNSTVKLLTIYKQFRDQVAHGRTIIEPLKNPSDLNFKRIALSNLCNEDTSISLEQYLQICNYWDNI